jgi:hypothetical protein
MVHPMMRRIVGGEFGPLISAIRPTRFPPLLRAGLGCRVMRYVPARANREAE